MTVIYIVLLLVANGFFVAAEFALVKVPAVRLDAMVASGSPMARLTRQIHSNLEAYLAACQLGITMASLGLGWIGEPAVAALLEPLLGSWGVDERTLHTISFLLGFILFSSLHIVIGEQVPKTYAIRRSDTVSLWIALPLQLFYWMAFPLNWLLNRASGGILRLLGVEEVSHTEVLSGGEIRGLIDVSRDHGAIGRGTAVMLEKVFKFDERPVVRIMLPRSEIARLDISAGMDEVLALIERSRHSRFPVIDERWTDVKGVVLAKDLLLAQLAAPVAMLRDVESLIRPAQLVPETQPINVLFDLMRASREHMALVVDEYGQVSGLVTLEDLVEEIVGEIADESDVYEQVFRIVPDPEGWKAHGLVSLSDLERETGLDVGGGDEGPSTVAGLIMLELNRVPKAGDEITQAGFTMRVLEMKGSRVEQVLVRALAPETGGGEANHDSGDES